MKKSEKGKEGGLELILILVVVALFFLRLVSSLSIPGGPVNVNVTNNETKSLTAGYNFTTAGGYIATMNLTVTAQNVKWKGLVGWVSGRFTLDDSSGSTLYDWALTSLSGNVYMTRNSSAPTWSQIKCANTTILETENSLLNHTGISDNISITFNNRSHNSMTVSGNSIGANTCPVLRTYINNVSHTDMNFSELALFDGVDDASGGNVVYAIKIEPQRVGFDSNLYDFQAIVPENGLASWTGRTSYYIYVELS